jgi:hypothetical protein
LSFLIRLCPHRPPDIDTIYLPHTQLRDIEILAQQKTEALEAAGAAEDETLKEIQKILYSTEVRPVCLFAFFTPIAHPHADPPSILFFYSLHVVPRPACG